MQGDITYSDHFIQLQTWYYVVCYIMWLTFFLRSIVMLKNYFKVFSIYSYLIIVGMNIGFLARAIIYNLSTLTYGPLKFNQQGCFDTFFMHFESFQDMMLIVSIINWILNMVYDIIVIKMYTVYRIFNAKSHAEMKKIQRNMEIFHLLFTVSYLSVGITLNFLSFSSINQASESNNGKGLIVTILGGTIFIIDMIMMVIGFQTIKNIITYYTVDYEINTCLVWFFVSLCAITYVIEMVWSDLSMWGSYFNTSDVYFKPKEEVPIQWFVFSVETFNSIFCTWIQGNLILSVFNHFGQIKFKNKKITLKREIEKMEKNSLSLEEQQIMLTNPSNPKSLLSLVESKKTNKSIYSRQESDHEKIDRATEKFFGKKEKKEVRVDSNMKTELSMPIEKKTNFTKEHRSDQSIDVIRKFSEVSEEED